MGIIRQTRNLFALLGLAVTVNYCSNTLTTPTNRQVNDSSLHFDGNYVMYEARTGESIEDLYKSEG